MIGRAFELALRAHKDQTDKAGFAYIGHVARVAAGVDGEAEIVTALLHDVVEDCDVTLDDIRSAFGPDIAEAVDAITRRSNEEPASYYQRVRNNPVARRVKLSDIADNSHPDRLRLLPPQIRTRLSNKYAVARGLLT